MIITAVYEQDINKSYGTWFCLVFSGYPNSERGV